MEQRLAIRNDLGNHAVVLWTTRYLDAAVDTPRALPASEREHDILDEHVARWHDCAPGETYRAHGGSASAALAR